MLAGIVAPARARAESPADPVAASHIEANVPAKADFDRFMKRDLTVYFSGELRKPVTVAWELIREAPTQTGVGDPKFYAWVRVFSRGKPVLEGAVRLAAIDRKQFEVLRFMSLSKIREDPDKVLKVFPRPVGEKILGRVWARK